MVEHLLAKEGVAGSMTRLPARSLLLLRRVIHRMTATRLALLFFKRYPMDTSFVILFPRRVSNPRGFDVSPTGSVVASASQSHPPDDRNPSRAFFYIFRSFLCLYIYMENLKIKTLS